MIQSNIIHSSFKSGVKKLLFLGSSCIYPKFAKQPIKEDILLTGKLEETNEPYAIAKIAGIKMCESYNRQYGLDYRSVMPTNLYGPGDNYDNNMSHVIPALIKRFHEAKIEKKESVRVWGSGLVRREFLFVQDLAEACVLVMNCDGNRLKEISTPMLSHINIGSNKDITIKELSYLIAKVVDYKGNIKKKEKMLDGVKQKLLDCTKINQLGWSTKVCLEDGLNLSYIDFLEGWNVRQKN